MFDVIERFLQSEITYQDSYEAIIQFIDSNNIRNGEYEGDYFIIKKMDRINILIYAENTYENASDDNYELNYREIPYSISIYKDNLLKRINEYALKAGLNLI